MRDFENSKKPGRYAEIISKMPSFLSLDISKCSTGYVSWSHGNLTLGLFAMPEVQTVKESVRLFSDWLRSIIAEGDYAFYFVEGCIMGKNFETTQVLVRLNGVIDDLMTWGLIPERPVHRKTAIEWNKILYDATGGAAYPLIDRSARKESTVSALKKFDFDVFEEIKSRNIVLPKSDSYEDIADAMGLAVSFCLETFQKQKQSEQSEDDYSDLLMSDFTESWELCTDLKSRLLKFKQYFSREEMQKAVERSLKRKTTKYTGSYSLVYDESYPDLQKQFKATVEELACDTYIFMAETPISKIKYPFITKTWDLTQGSYVYFTVQLKNP